MQPIKSLKIHLFKKLTNDYAKLGRYLSVAKPNRKRNFNVYCVGLPRSGTHSIAKMFEDSFRCAHEPYHSSIINYLINGDLDSCEVTEQFLLTRDRLLNLELESSQYLYRFTPELVNLFPDSKFILTVREPKSWLESEFNKLLRSYKDTKNNIWRNYDRIKYNKYNNIFESEKLKHTEHIYPLKSILNYYKDHILLVKNSVPDDRLLILDTFEINTSLEKISAFINVAPTQINTKKIHSGRNHKKVPITEFIDQNLLDELVHQETYTFIRENVPALEKYL